MAPTPWRGGRVNAVPDCPQYQGALPDKFGDWGLVGLCNQQASRSERAGPMARPNSSPLVFRPPIGEWSPQTGMGAPETRFTDRMYRKGEDSKAPVFRLKGSSPMRSGSSFVKTFNRQPEYKEDPWDAKIATKRTRAAAERALMADGKAFKPTSYDLDYRTSKNATPAFRPIYSSSIVFRPSNLRR